MDISPVSIEQEGPGVDLSNQPEGIAIQMSDPVEDFEYQRNTVTLTFDLFGFEGVRLAFEAMEFGDEPHAPKDEGGSENSENLIGFGPVVGFDFDGVAVSVDGVDWYEIQDLRSLRSDRFTAYDIDLDAVVAGLGVSYGTAFRVRFCQYDNNPAPKDGVFLHSIALTGAAPASLVLHLAMNDNAASPTVVDVSSEGQHQVLVDPGGDPNTDAHSVPGVVATALHLDEETYIDCGTVADALLAEDQDFAIAFWWKSPGGGTGYAYAASNMNVDTTQGLFWFTHDGNFRVRVEHDGAFSHRHTWTGGDDGVWHHYVVQREGTRIDLWRDAVLDLTDDSPANTDNLVAESLDIGKRSSGSPAAGTVDDFRVYDRALTPTEIVALATAPGS